MGETTGKTFIFFSEFGEILDVAIKVKAEGNTVLMYIKESDYKAIGEGLVEKIDNWYSYMGKGCIWIFDSCSFGKLQDFLREKGEIVFGGSEYTDKLENQRQLNQRWFKSAGFLPVESKNFKNIDEAIGYVKENKGIKLILKQNGSAPKSINHKGHFEDGSDMIFHLEQLKKGWNESDFGEFDVDLMTIVEGLEVAASAYFNGTDFLRDKNGKITGWLNMEHKMQLNEDLGSVTGETGTLFIQATEDNPLFKDILLKPKILEVLRKIGFRGVFDINCIKTDKGIVALEPTCRFGIPASSYEFIDGLEMPTGELLEIVARGETKPISLKEGIGMVIVVYAPPFPVEGDLPKEKTSIGERLWILQDRKPIKDFTKEQKKHIHLENFKKITNEESGETYYSVATSNGYLLVVSGSGKAIDEVRENLIKYIKENIFISEMGYRTDIGKRVEEYYGTSKNAKDMKKAHPEFDDLKNSNKKYKEALLEKEKELKAQKTELYATKQKHLQDIASIKEAIKKSIYED